MAGKTAVKTDVKAGRFRQKVLSFMKKNHMTDRGDSVLAACCCLKSVLTRPKRSWRCWRILRMCRRTRIISTFPE